MMWKIEKPDFGKACGKDINELIMHCDKLDDGIKPELKELYRIYDTQNGLVTLEQLSLISEEKADAIHSQYCKTREGNKLSYIRSELMERVFKCPYCSINQPTTLDHYMPKSQYKALSVFRMNLVPMCAACNNLKLAKPFDNFVHCYYQAYPEEPFLKAKIFVVLNRFVAEFYIDDTVLADAELIRKVHYQMDQLKIIQNIEKESTVFISTLCKEFCSRDNDELKLCLNRKLSAHIENYGYNDWRCAILRGLLEWPDLDVSFFQYNKNNSQAKIR